MLDPRLNSIFESILDSQIWGPRPCPGHCATMSRNPARKRDHVPEDNHDIRDHVPWDDLQAATISRGIRIGPCRHEWIECGNRIANRVVIMSCGRNRDISRRRCLWRMDFVPCATMSRGIKSDRSRGARTCMTCRRWPNGRAFLPGLKSCGSLSSLANANANASMAAGSWRFLTIPQRWNRASTVAGDRCRLAGGGV